MKTRHILFGVFTLLFSACAAPNMAQPAQTVVSPSQTALASVPTSLPTQTVSVLPTETGTQTKTYTDASAGFSLDYPASWFIDASAATNASQSFAYSVGIATWDLHNPPTPSGKGQNGIPAGGTKIDVNVMKQAMTLQEAVAQQHQNENSSPILAQKDVTLANGLPGVILDMEGPTGLVRTLITALNGNIIYVSGYGNLENFETIALTLRPK